ncbi:MAG TPA: hypothetical protein PLW39_10910 [Thermoflexales bacterium]|nr:hypothetical protein [Thermoflexales bacterium]HQW35932.1 hypothetical protein [Thermoflexales bacterium]HQZ22764.1 hypothetical protein [Thermoflexales bacterium]
MNVDNRLVELISETSGFIGSQTREGERAAVIIGAARIDAAIENLLKSVLVNNPTGKKEDNLFGPDRPLGTFSAKISLGYRMGLFDRDVEQALNCIRKIRNLFAHGYENITLDSNNDLTKEFIKLRQFTDKSGYKKAIFSAIQLTDPSMPESLLQFATSTASILLILEIAITANTQRRNNMQRFIYEAKFHS